MGNKQSTGTPPLQISSKSSVVPVNHKLYSEILSNNIPNAPPNTPSNTPSTLQLYLDTLIHSHHIGY